MTTTDDPTSKHMPENPRSNPRPGAARQRQQTRHRRQPGSAPDPRGPFVYDVRPLGRRPGSMRADNRWVAAPAGLGSDLIGVPDGTPLAVEVRLESATEGVLVTGTVTTSVAGQCARCLDPIADELHADIVELFAYPDSITDETSDADEVHRVENDLVDLEPVVHDAIVLALPWTPLCRSDCAGLCPTCGQRLDALPAGHSHDMIDPRWAALATHSAATEEQE